MSDQQAINKLTDICERLQNQISSQTIALESLAQAMKNTVDHLERMEKRLSRLETPREPYSQWIGK